MKKQKTSSLACQYFTRIPRGIGRKDLIGGYYKFDSSLHLREFYEMITSLEEIGDLLSELGDRLNNIIKVIRGHQESI